MNKIVNLKNVSFAYKKKRILEDCSFTINKGDVLAVLGHNGAGKTTLIRIIAGLAKVKFGNVERNLDISKIGLMNESLGLYPFLNAKKNLELLMLRHKEKYDNSKIECLLNQFGINSDEIVANFSTGMKKKLSLLGVLLSKPELFLLDEPFSGLDSVSLNYIINKIKENTNEKNAFVIVNHDLPSTIKLCNKFLIINNGKIVYFSDKISDIQNLEEIYAKYSE